MKDRVEILAPAGSMECLKAAIAAGADIQGEPFSGHVLMHIT